MSAIVNKQLIANNHAIRRLAEEADKELRKKHASVKKEGSPILVEDIGKSGKSFHTIQTEHSDLSPNS